MDDVATAIEIFDNPGQGLEVLDLFLEQFRTTIDSVREGLEKAEPRKVREAAHSIAGAAAMLKFQEIAAMFLAVERAARAEDLATAACEFAGAPGAYQWLAGQRRARYGETADG